MTTTSTNTPAIYEVDFDPLAPARGIFNGAWMSLLLWALLYITTRAPKTTRKHRT